MGATKMLGLVLAAFVALAWLAWIILLGGVSAVTSELNSLKDNFGADNEAINAVIADATAFTWTILWVLFVVLALASAAVVVALAMRKRSLFKTLARLLLFLLAVVLGWMGKEADEVRDLERSARGDGGDALEAASGVDLAGPYGAMLAGYILLFLALFGMAFALVFALSDSAGSSAGAIGGVEGSAAKSHAESVHVNAGGTGPPQLVHGNAQLQQHGSAPQYVSPAQPQFAAPAYSGQSSQQGAVPLASGSFGEAPPPQQFAPHGSGGQVPLQPHYASSASGGQAPMQQQQFASQGSGAQMPVQQQQYASSVSAGQAPPPPAQFAAQGSNGQGAPLPQFNAAGQIDPASVGPQ